MNIKELYEQHGSLKAVFRNTDHPWNQIRDAYHKAVRDGVMDPLGTGRKRRDGPKPSQGYVRATKAERLLLPKRGSVNHYLFTCAQNNTKVWQPFWQNLTAYAQHLGADIHISRFTYQKRALGAQGDKKVATKEAFAEAEDFWWDDVLAPYFSDTRQKVAPGLVWVGDMNILPTASNPLSGLQTYTGTDSSIFPHVKLALESVPDSKMVYTTGTVTKRNYVQRKAGLKAELHHVYGALLVEVDDKGRWWARQINADKTGAFYDLTTRVAGGKITQGYNAEAVVWGDIHCATLTDTNRRLGWGKGGILDTLHPKTQFFHDVMDFHGPSHHAVKNPHEMFRRHCGGFLDVRNEVVGLCKFLRYSARDWCQSVVVRSNHDEHLERWLREQNGLKDPLNAQFWLAMNNRIYAAIADGREIEGLSEAVQEVNPQPGVRFLQQDESCRVAGIECGIHGHAGPNGSRGTPRGLTKIGDKAITGHTHSAGIIDGVYTVGMSGHLKPDYVKGPSSWSTTHCVVYPNGKRTLVTVKDGRWWAKSGPLPR